MEVNHFNLRVYGLLFFEGQVLVTHENRQGMLMTKFPGGGLEKGEGLADCLSREFKEELDIEIQVADFFYVNDFLQISNFNENHQVISFYYKVETDEIDDIPDQDYTPNIPKSGQIFEWVKLNDLVPDKFTFAIDKVVAKMLAQSL